MTVDIIHEGGGCEQVVKQSRGELEVHIHLCENKATHIAYFTGPIEKKCCAECGARWLESGFLVDLVPL